MQDRQIRLKEIIWEITGYCNNHCEYCGSKDGQGIRTPDETIIKIAKEIAKYPPYKVNISGGDPLCLESDLHKEVVKILKDGGVKEVAVIVNPKSFGNGKFLKAYHSMSEYDYAGISINDENDIGAYINFIKSTKNWFKNSYKQLKRTFITNFNLKNIFLFEKIEEFVNKRNASWQTQYTMSLDNPANNIFNDKNAVTHLTKIINKSIKNGTRIILADNMNNISCAAGISSLGILCNGDVIPCVSMRAWNKDIKYLIQGNIISDGLEKIWIECFTDYRFKSFECCKDFCKNAEICIDCSQKDISKNSEKEIEKLQIPGIQPLKSWPKRTPEDPQVFLYGVTDPSPGPEWPRKSEPPYPRNPFRKDIATVYGAYDPRREININEVKHTNSFGIKNESSDPD